MTWNVNDVDTTTVYSFGANPTEAGVYKVKVSSGTEMYTTDAGNRRIRFTALVEAGAFEGYQISDGLNIDPWDKVKGFWGNFLVSTGVGRKDLAKTLSKGIGPHLIENKVAYCRYVPADASIGRRYPEKDWVPKAVYDAFCRQQEAAADAAPVAEDNGTPEDSASFMSKL